MSTALRDVLLERADRVETAPTSDPRAFAALVRERAEARRRSRRNVRAAGGGVALIAALVLGALVLPSSDGQHDAAPAGVSVEPSSASVRPATTDPAAARAAAAARSAAAAASAAASAASRARTAAKPVTLAPTTTPKAAAVAIGLVPQGWHYLGHDGPVTYYGPAAMAPTNDADFGVAIEVDVHARPNSNLSSYTVTVDGRPARYSADSGVTVVTVVVDTTTELNIQLPVSAPVTRSQALAIAATLDLRSEADKTEG